MAENITLYHSWKSTCSRKVRVCLAEKQLEYTSIPIDLSSFDHHRPEYLALNPNGYVPTLVHDGMPLIESTVINEYLDDAFPQKRLRPQSALVRAKMRTWCKFADDHALPAVVVPTWTARLAPTARSLSDAELESKLRSIPLVERRERWFKVARSEFSSAEFQSAFEKLTMMFDRMEADLKQSKWLACDEFTLADVSIAPYAVRAQELDPAYADIERWPSVMEWLKALRLRPWFRSIFVDSPSGALQKGDVRSDFLPI